MSASPIARQATQCQTIPSRRVVINDASQLPADYSTTPGGTVYSTTPGGRLTRNIAVCVSTHFSRCSASCSLRCVSLMETNVVNCTSRKR